MFSLSDQEEDVAQLRNELGDDTDEEPLEQDDMEGHAESDHDINSLVPDEISKEWLGGHVGLTEITRWDRLDAEWQAECVQRGENTLGVSYYTA